jgi:hypothetical protein
VRLTDDDGTDQGAALIAGIETAPARAWSAQASVGTSPVGFEGGVYPTWAGRAAWRATPYLNLAVETGRAPRTDTRASWAGTVFPSTLQRYGRVSQLWGGLEASAGDGTWDAGLLARGGYVEGIGVDPNPMGEGTWWVGRAWHPGRADVRLGADGIAMTYARREDGLVPGEGGYFSPPFFGTAIARLDASMHGARWGACAGVGGGARYQQGEGSNAFDTVGMSTTLTGHLGAAWELPARWRVVGDLRGEQASTGWRQIAGLLRVAWGAQPSASAAAPTPLGAPGFMLPADSTLCTTGASR